MVKKTVSKVVAYITQGDKLLVFSHPGQSEAGIQVPAGTVEPGESPEQAVLREAREETGLHDLELRAYLGETEFDAFPYGRDEINVRHYFHLVFHGRMSATWKHNEMHPSDGSPAPIELEFYWVKYPDEVPELIGGLGEMLSALHNPRLGES
jgi:8-oxo-dGTP pyrophosphatase MutT (NUDIX family)